MVLGESRDGKLKKEYDMASHRSLGHERFSRAQLRSVDRNSKATKGVNGGPGQDGALDGQDELTLVLHGTDD
tara:strand:- start:2388 stop:2603 length:216 start_codon:yes stop_codon:yes gene_type:complete